MKTITPQNDVVLCRLKNSPTKTTESGFIYKSNDVPLYEIVEVSKNIPNENIDLAVGDVVRTNSIGTVVNKDGVDYYLFKIENIAGKVVR